MELLEKYKGMKVFLTGHTGFKGSWLCMMLKELGADVYGFSLEHDKDVLYEVSAFSDQDRYCSYARQYWRNNIQYLRDIEEVILSIKKDR